MAVYQFRTEQKIPAPRGLVWDFISSPLNLGRITPPEMNFRVTTEQLPAKMYPGMIISYRVRPLLGIPVTWVTEITHVKEEEYFVDEQRVGPYSFWHHQHRIEEVNGGVRMTDIVTYRPPWGIIGRIANALVIRAKLAEIFRFRAEILERVFPGS